MKTDSCPPNPFSSSGPVTTLARPRAASYSTFLSCSLWSHDWALANDTCAHTLYATVRFGPLRQWACLLYFLVPSCSPELENGAQYRQGQCMVVTHGFTLGKTLGRWAHLWSRATTRLDGHLRTATWKGSKHLVSLSHFCLGVPLLQELSFTFKWNVSSRYGVPSMLSTKPLVSSFRQYQKLYFTWVTRQLLPTSNTKS